MQPTAVFLSYLSARVASCLTTCALLFSLEGEGGQRDGERERASECERERARERDESSQDHENIVMPLRMIVELKEAAANGLHVCVKMNRSIFEFFFKITGGAERGYSKRSDAVRVCMCVCLFARSRCQCVKVPQDDSRAVHCVCVCRRSRNQCVMVS